MFAYNNRNLFSMNSSIFFPSNFPRNSSCLSFFLLIENKKKKTKAFSQKENYLFF